MAWFDDYELKDALTPDVPNSIYELIVADGEIGYWDDGRLRVDISTKITGTEFDGRYGPRKTYSFGGFSGTTKDGREFEISADEQEESFVKGILIMMDGHRPAVAEKSVSEKSVAQVMKQLKGHHFYGRVRTDNNGYLQLGRMYPMSQPPKVVKAQKTKAFSVNLDDV